MASSLWYWRRLWWMLTAVLYLSTDRHRTSFKTPNDNRLLLPRTTATLKTITFTVPVCARRCMRLKLTYVETTHRNLTTDRERRFQLPPCAISPRSWICFRRNWPFCVEYFRKPTLLEPGILELKCGHDLCLATWFLNNKHNVALQVFSFQGTFGSDKRWGYPRVITTRSERIVFVFASS